MTSHCICECAVHRKWLLSDVRSLLAVPSE